MPKVKKESSEESEILSDDEVITDIITVSRFKENGVSKVKRVYLNGDKVVKEVIEND